MHIKGTLVLVSPVCGDPLVTISRHGEFHVQRQQLVTVPNLALFNVIGPAGFKPMEGIATWWQAERIAAALDAAHKLGYDAGLQDGRCDAVECDLEP